MKRQFKKLVIANMNIHIYVISVKLQKWEQILIRLLNNAVSCIQINFWKEQDMTQYRHAAPVRFPKTNSRSSVGLIQGIILSLASEKLWKEFEYVYKDVAEI